MHAPLGILIALLMGAQLLTPEQIAGITDIVRHDPVAFSQFQWIAPKEKASSGVTPLVYTPIQQRTNALMEHLRVDLLQPERIINAKARQVKLTTYWTSRGYWYHWRSPGPRQTNLIGDISDTTTSMFEMWDRYYEYLPYYLKRPVTSRVTHKFRDTQALVKTHTALTPNKRPAQGTTSSTIIATEVPYFKKGEDLLLAMLNAVPRLPETLVVLEGTANGSSGAFYEKWLEAIDHVDQLCKEFGAKDLYDLLWNLTGWGDKPDKYGHTHPMGYWDGTFIPLFYGWWENPEYVWPAHLEGVSDETLTNEEIDLKTAYNLTNEQLAWRRFTIRENCGKSLDKFKQEYPAHWEEAFRMSGGLVFTPSETVDEHLRRTQRLAKAVAVKDTPMGKREIPVLQTVRLDWGKDKEGIAVNRHAPIYDVYGRCLNQDDLKVEVYADVAGWIQMRHKPRKTHHYRYVIGADVAEGLEQGDYSVAVVLDRVDMSYPAIVRVHASEAEFALMLAKLGLWYGNAGILVERNKGGGGSEVINNLRKVYRRILSGIQFHDGKDVIDKKLGWLTTHESKIVLVGAVQSMIDNYAHGLHWEVVWREFTTFTREPNGSMGAEGKRLDPGTKAFDDCVIALGLANMAHRFEVAPSEILAIDEITKQQAAGKVRTLYEVPYS